MRNTIKEIKTVTDFINFEKFRAVTDSGMEFYWLETTYKDKKYKTHKVLSWNSKGIISFSLLSPCVFLLLENIHAYRVKQINHNDNY